MVVVIGNVGLIDAAVDVFYDVLRQLSFQCLRLCRVIDFKVFFVGIAELRPVLIRTAFSDAYSEMAVRIDIA